MISQKLYILILVLILFMSACSEKDSSSETTSPAATPGISIVNVSDVSTTDLESWTAAAAAKMKSQTANILSVSWNVGTQVSQDGFNRPYNTHQVVITNAQIETLMSSISSWFDTTCMDSDTKSEELTNFRNYITNGADASSHLVMCKQYRIIILGFPSTMAAADRKGLVIHEFYHAFQKDISDDTCGVSSTNRRWLVEGGAQYFTVIHINGSSGVSKILETALGDYQADNDTAITGSGIASRGAAGIRHMIERDWLPEASILDGSFFDSCESESDYTDSNSNVVSTKSLWYKIESSSGVYSFTSEAVP